MTSLPDASAVRRPADPPVAPGAPRWDLDFEALASHLAPLGSATRLRLLNFLTTPRYLEEIASFLEMNRFAAKKHVDQLVETGVVAKAPAQRPDGLVVEYRIVPERLFEVFDEVRALGTLRPTSGPSSDLSRTKHNVGGARGDRHADTPRLVAVYAIEIGTPYLLERKEGSEPRWLLGRDASCEVRLHADPFASAKHAQVERKGRSFVVTDLYSTNGTFLDWERVPAGQSREIANGQVLGIGKTLLLFRDR